MDMVKRIVLDAKIDYPAACNAVVSKSCILLKYQIIYVHRMRFSVEQYHVVDFFFPQETLLVHEHLVNSGGFNELVLELQTEG